MQPVDVLRDHVMLLRCTRDARRDEPVRRRWCRLLQFDADRCRATLRLQRPKTVWSPEIGNIAVRRDAGASEPNDRIRLLHHFGDLVGIASDFLDRVIQLGWIDRRTVNACR